MSFALRAEKWPTGHLPGMSELPYSDGEPMEIPDHRLQMTLLIESLRLGWAERDDFFIDGNMFLYFNPNQSKNSAFRGPDIFVVLNTERRRFRTSWVLWEEHCGPSVVIELLSPTTEKVDRGEKMLIYAQTLEVENYFLYDTRNALFEGYHLDRRTLTYRRLKPNPKGRIHSAALDLWLGVVPWSIEGREVPMLRWFDAQGQMFPTPEEQAVQRAAQAEVEARAERLRVRREQKRALQAEAQAHIERERALQAEAETQAERERALQAEAEAQVERERALQAEAEAQAERERALQAEAEAQAERSRAEEQQLRIRELEAALAELRLRLG